MGYHNVASSRGEGQQFRYIFGYITRRVHVSDDTTRSPLNRLSKLDYGTAVLHGDKQVPTSKRLLMIAHNTAVRLLKPNCRRRSIDSITLFGTDTLFLLGQMSSFKNPVQAMRHLPRPKL